MNRGHGKSAGIHDRRTPVGTRDDGFVRLQVVDAELERVRVIARRRRKASAAIVDEFTLRRRAEAAKG